MLLHTKRQVLKILFFCNIRYVVSSCLLPQFVFCFLLKLKWPKNKIVYGMEVSLFGIPANRAHPKRNSANSNN